MAETEEQEEGQGKKKSGLIVTIAIVLVLSGVAGAGGWVLGGILAPQVAVEDDAAGAAAPAKGEKGDKGGKSGQTENKPRENVLPLEPITTNLSYPSDNWIRIEVSLLFSAAPDQALADQIHQDILSYLRTVSLQQIEGPRGFQYLRDDLRERVKLRSEGRVDDILFRTFVIE
jgi:flagellar FliL protein